MAEVVEEVPLALKLDDRMVRSPTTDRVEDALLVNEGTHRVITCRVHNVVSIAGGIR